MLKNILFTLSVLLSFAGTSFADCISLRGSDICTGDRVYVKKYMSKTSGKISGFDSRNNQIIVDTDAFGKQKFYFGEIAFPHFSVRGVGYGDMVKIKYNGIRTATVLGVYLDGSVFVNLDGYHYMVFSSSSMMSFY